MLKSCISQWYYGLVRKDTSSSGMGGAWHGSAHNWGLTMPNTRSIMGYKDWGFCYGL
nr:MAG TPA: Protein of unknown function (DUF1408) [Caudoviricetes sp.]